MARFPASAGSITEIESTDSSVTITDPMGPTVDLTGAGGGSGGTVTDVTGVNANGFTFSIATPTTTPAIELATSVTGLVKGNGTALSAATAGTDYLTPTGSGAALTGITQSQVSGSQAGPLTGDVTTVGAAATLVGTTNVENIIAANSTVASKAPTASPTFTGTPAAPTAAAGTNTTQLATTAFAQTAVSGAQNLQNLTPSVSGSGTLTESILGGVKQCVLTLAAWDDAGQTLTFTTAYTADVPGFEATPGIPSSFVPTASKTTFQLPTTSAAAITGVFIIRGV